MRKFRLSRSGDDRLAQQFALDLNAAQHAAATAPDGYNLILAGPGSGKTRVIIYRVAHLIARGVEPQSILLVTFTRRAAREMVGRLEALIGARAKEVWAGTFHHIGNRLLRRFARVIGLAPNFTILDTEDQMDLLRLSMSESGLFGTGKLAPKPPAVHSLLSFAANVGRPIGAVVYDRNPDLAAWIPRLEATATAYAARKLAANSLDYDDLLNQWARLLSDFPEAREAMGRQFSHILIDEMQDTNAVQVGVVEAIAAAGPGNLTAVGDDAQSIYRFRGANYANILEFNARHPDARVFRLEQNYRSTPEIVAFTNASIRHNRTGFPKTLVSTRAPGLRPVVLPVADAYEEAEFICQQILELHEQGTPLNKMAVLYRNHHDSIVLQGEIVARGINYTVRSGVRFFEQAHIKDVMAYLRIVTNPRDEPAWRRLLLLLPGVGQSTASTVCAALVSATEPLQTMATAEVMKKLSAKSRGFFAGFVADVQRIQKVDPEHHPAAAINAVLQGGYPATLRTRHDRPEIRLADLEQLSVLAARHQSLERMVAELMLAGDIYGMDTIDGNEAEEHLVLSTVHQAKGLEWSRVFIPRLIEESFPNGRSLGEPGGEDEERRIFYVAVTRAMDELYMTYPLAVSRGGRGPYVLTRPSRFLSEVDPAQFEPAVIETGIDLSPSRAVGAEGRTETGAEDDAFPPW